MGYATAAGILFDYEDFFPLQNVFISCGRKVFNTRKLFPAAVFSSSNSIINRLRNNSRDFLPAKCIYFLWQELVCFEENFLPTEIIFFLQQWFLLVSDMEGKCDIYYARILGQISCQMTQISYGQCPCVRGENDSLWILKEEEPRL